MGINDALFFEAGERGGERERITFPVAPLPLAEKAPGELKAAVGITDALLFKAGEGGGERERIPFPVAPEPLAEYAPGRTGALTGAVRVVSGRDGSLLAAVTKEKGGFPAILVLSVSDREEESAMTTFAPLLCGPRLLLEASMTTLSLLLCGPRLLLDASIPSPVAAVPFAPAAEGSTTANCTSAVTDVVTKLVGSAMVCSLTSAAS